MIRPLIYYGNPILRKQCVAVESVTPEVAQVVKDLKDTLMSINGSGLSAPQIGVLLRIFVLEPDRRESTDVYKGIKAYINPKITIVDGETEILPEGCLSIPKLYEDLERPYRVKIEALDEFGRPFEEVATGWRARGFVHENDHLNGVLYIDRLFPNARKRIEPLLKKIKKKYNP